MLITPLNPIVGCAIEGVSLVSASEDEFRDLCIMAAKHRRNH